MQKLQEAYENRNKKINKIEKLKELKTPISVYDRLDEICANGLENLKDEDSGFFLKCFGAFLKKDETFMLRIRIPAGQLTPKQAVKIGQVSKEYGENYIDITTRQQIELRYIKLENLSTILKELDSVGVTTFQTGVDNFRNIVTSSFDGLGDTSIITCKPIIDELQNIFIKKDEWIGQLPRKFNTAILGNTINDCNIYGHDCCFVLAKKDETLGFNLYLGGKVGVQAEDSGLFVKQDEVVTTFNTIIELFKKYGFRDNRNKNRLHFLIQEVGMDTFIEAIKEVSKMDYLSSGEILAKDEYKIENINLNEQIATYFPIPSGVFSGSDMAEAGILASQVDGIIRLSVEQSFFIISNRDNSEFIQDSPIYSKYHKFNNIYFNNQIACAGTATCAFGVIPNKPDAIELANYLAQEVPMSEGKVRMYWSACPKGCGIHGVADIGFEGCKAKDKDGNKVDGVHIYLGGKATNEAKEARVIAKAVPLTKAKYIVKDLMLKYKNEKLPNESFEAFDDRVLSKMENVI